MCEAEVRPLAAVVRCACATVRIHACGLVNASERKCGGGVVQRGARMRECIFRVR